MTNDIRTIKLTEQEVEAIAGLLRDRVEVLQQERMPESNNLANYMEGIAENLKEQWFTNNDEYVDIWLTDGTW